jgi:hypothetical protein
MRTAVARAAAGGELTSAALTQAELAQLRTQAFSGATLTEVAKQRAHTAVAAALGAAQLAASGVILAKLVDGWLVDLERILGGIADADVDPRYVEGLLVEVRRS